MPNDNLATLVQGLPVELFDAIYNLTFTASSNQPREVDDHYAPPHLLRIDRKSRTLFATSYYGNNSTFYIPHELLKKFLGSIPKAHCAHIVSIRVLDDLTYSSDPSPISLLANSAFALSLCGLAPKLPGHPTFEKDVFHYEGPACGWHVRVEDTV